MVLKHRLQVTLRGIDPEIAQTIERIAREEGISLNKAALGLLAKGADLPRKAGDRGCIGHDLDHLFGTWSEAQARAFLQAVRSCEQVDEGFWQ